MISLLERWTRSFTKSALPPLHVTVYNREQCGCCRKAMAVLQKYERKYNLEIEQIDVDSDPELVTLYGRTVPVVAVEGKVRFKGIVNPVLLERLLTSERQALQSRLSTKDS